jgi:hypothetical protein
MALPFGTTGSLCPTFVPDRHVRLTVKHPCAIALCGRLPSVLRVPWEASVTLWEATTPVKLPTKQCPPGGVRAQEGEGPYFNVGYPTAGAAVSMPPAYPTHPMPRPNAKL